MESSDTELGSDGASFSSEVVTSDSSSCTPHRSHGKEGGGSETPDIAGGMWERMQRGGKGLEKDTKRFVRLAGIIVFSLCCLLLLLFFLVILVPWFLQRRHYIMEHRSSEIELSKRGESVYPMSNRFEDDENEGMKHLTDGMYRCALLYNNEDWNDRRTAASIRSLPSAISLFLALRLFFGSSESEAKRKALESIKNEFRYEDQEESFTSTKIEIDEIHCSLERYGNGKYICQGECRDGYQFDCEISDVDYSKEELENKVKEKFGEDCMKGIWSQLIGVNPKTVNPVDYLLNSGCVHLMDQEVDEYATICLEE